MSEATLIMPNMRGGCATVGTTVHTLFRVNGRRPGISAHREEAAASRHAATTDISQPDAALPTQN